MINGALVGEKVVLEGEIVAIYGEHVVIETSYGTVVSVNENDVKIAEGVK